ncbi:MAG TPA: hypothetical protein QGH10_01705, partial [Armatimonadota bacterium]|nr:hypothetical protein [Armatimonadota bacterium]
SHDVIAEIDPPNVTVDEGGYAPFKVNVRNRGTGPIQATVTPSPGGGLVTPATHEVTVPAGATAAAEFVWHAGELPPGHHAVPVSIRARAGGLGQITRGAVAEFTINHDEPAQVAVVKVETHDRRVGEAYEVYAEIENRDKEAAVTVSASCVILEARRHLPSQEITIAAGAKVGLRWRPAPDSEPLRTGVYNARVTVPALPGVAGQAGFVVK